jgi:hypothetical protein
LISKGNICSIKGHVAIEDGTATDAEKTVGGHVRKCGLIRHAQRGANGQRRAERGSTAHGKSVVCRHVGQGGSAGHAERGPEGGSTAHGKSVVCRHVGKGGSAGHAERGPESGSTAHGKSVVCRHVGKRGFTSGFKFSANQDTSGHVEISLRNIGL